MAKANGINLNLTFYTGYPLASAVGNLPRTKMNSGTNGVTGYYWNGSATGVWVSPFGALRMNGSSSGACQYSGTSILSTITGYTFVSSSNLGVPSYVGGNSGTTILYGASGPVAAGFGAATANGAGIGVAPRLNRGSGFMSIETLPFTSVVATTTTAMNAAGTRIIANNASTRVVLTSASAVVGAIFTISGLGAAGWRVSQSAGQQIIVGSTATTVGTGGYIQSTNQYDSVEIVCIVAGTTFSVCGQAQSSGLTIV